MPAFAWRGAARRQSLGQVQGWRLCATRPAGRGRTGPEGRGQPVLHPPLLLCPFPFSHTEHPAAPRITLALAVPSKNPNFRYFLCFLMQHFVLPYATETFSLGPTDVSPFDLQSSYESCHVSFKLCRLCIDKITTKVTRNAYSLNQVYFQLSAVGLLGMGCS